MNTAFAVGAVAVVSMLTLTIGTFGLRLRRTTSDFFVASRAVRPALNASAIGGEYLSAASFLGVAGLVLAFGADMLWYPIGWTAGYLVLLVLVAAPLRRSGAYTLPDFAAARLRSQRVRAATSLLVVALAWLYLIPQFQGAGLTWHLATGMDRRIGGLVVVAVTLVNVLAGGMRSVTAAQAVQYWLKLTALFVPLVFLLWAWLGDGAPSPTDPAFDLPGHEAAGWADPLSGSHPMYTTYSIIVATLLGTMGLPHVVVRYYTNPDGSAARRTTVVVMGLLACFYALTPVYGALGRIYAGDLVAIGRSDLVALELPARMIGGLGAELLQAVLVAGAFAAFLSTSSGLTVAVAGVVSQDVVSRWAPGITAFRLSAVGAALVPYLISSVLLHLPAATAVALAFAVSASTFCPLLVLGIWWRRLTDVGAIVGLAVGGGLSGCCVVLAFLGDPLSGWWGRLVLQPAAWTVPAAFTAMIVGSLASRRRIPGHVTTFMVRLHTPENVLLDRGPQLRR